MTIKQQALIWVLVSVGCLVVSRFMPSLRTAVTHDKTEEQKVADAFPCKFPVILIAMDKHDKMIKHAVVDNARDLRSYDKTWDPSSIPGAVATYALMQSNDGRWLVVRSTYEDHFFMAFDMSTALDPGRRLKAAVEEITKGWDTCVGKDACTSGCDPK